MPRVFAMFLAAATLAAFAGDAVAQRNPTTADQIIEGLRPRAGGGTSRGLRSVPSQTTEGLRAVPSDSGASATNGSPAGGMPASTSPAKPAAAAPAVAAVQPQGAAPSVNLTVQFATGSAELTPNARHMLDELGRALSSSTLASYRFLIEGHTDTVGSSDMNLDLSARRAAAVRQYLIANFAIDPSRLEAVGRGENDLLIRTPDGTPEQRNRRVQVVNLDG